MVKAVAFLLFPGFEVLDVYGPLSIFSSPKLEGAYKVITVAKNAGPIVASNGVATVASESFETCQPLDILLIPGGIGTRNEVGNEELLAFIKKHASFKHLPSTVLTVCTGAALAAKAGLLKGMRATTNKAAWAWATAQSDETTTWLKTARWVEHGQIWTSAGVSAGIDMALAFIAQTNGVEIARRVAAYAEYNGDFLDSSNDPWGRLIDNSKSA